MRYHLNEHPMILLLREEYLPIEEFYSCGQLVELSGSSGDGRDQL